MTEALQRGSVVLYGGRYGVVWLVDGAELVLHPITKPARALRVHDVELSLAEIIGAGIEMPAARVRCGEPVRVDAESQVRVGSLGGAASCRMTLAVARAFAAAHTEEIWSLERRHRHEAASVRAVRQ